MGVKGSAYSDAFHCCCNIVALECLSRRNIAVEGDCIVNAGSVHRVLNFSHSMQCVVMLLFVKL